MEKQQEIRALIDKFILGQCTEREIETLIRYFKKGQITADFPHAHQVLGMLKEYPEMETSRVDEVYDRIIGVQRERNRQKRNRRKVYSLAAVFVGLMVLGSLWWTMDSPDTNTLVPVDAPVTLTLGNGKVELLEETEPLSLTDPMGNLIATTQGSILKYKETTASGPLGYNYLSVPYGKKFELNLADGSSVVLNGGSSLRYPVSFSGQDERRVILEGEGYFQVSRDENKPFKVQSGDLVVGVLGTSFNVSGYPEDDSMDVVLVEGSVRLTTGSQEVMLEPNFKASLFPQGNITVEAVDTGDYTAWIDGELVFLQLSFDDILKKMERHYNYEIINLDRVLGQESFNARFHEQPIETILHHFEITYGIEFRIEGNKIIID